MFSQSFLSSVLLWIRSLNALQCQHPNLAQFFGADGTARLLLWECLSTMALEGCPYEMPLLFLIQIQSLLIHGVSKSPSYRPGWNTSGLWHVEGDLFSAEVKDSLKLLLAPPSSLHRALYTYHGNLHLVRMNCLSTLPRASWNTGII